MHWEFVKIPTNHLLGNCALFIVPECTVPAHQLAFWDSHSLAHSLCGHSLNCICRRHQHFKIVLSNSLDMLNVKYPGLCFESYIPYWASDREPL